MGIKIIQQDSSVNNKGQALDKYRISRDDHSPLLLRVKLGFMFHSDTEKSTCLITKDKNFVDSIGKLVACLQADFPDVEIKSPITCKHDSSDEWLLYPYLSKYATFYDLNGNESFDRNGNLQGDFVLRVNSLSIIKSDESQRGFINMSYYQANVEHALPKKLDLNEISNDF